MLTLSKLAEKTGRSYQAIRNRKPELVEFIILIIGKNIYYSDDAVQYLLNNKRKTGIRLASPQTRKIEMAFIAFGIDNPVVYNKSGRWLWECETDTIKILGRNVSAALKTIQELFSTF